MVAAAGTAIIGSTSPTSSVIRSPRQRSVAHDSAVEAPKARTALGMEMSSPSAEAARRSRAGEAPMSLSRASWRLRPAMMIENVFAMTMAETKRAMRKKTNPTTVSRFCALFDSATIWAEDSHAVRIAMPCMMAVPKRAAMKTTRKLGKNCRGLARISRSGLIGDSRPPRRVHRGRAWSGRSPRR